MQLPALSKPIYVLRRLSRQLWVRMALIAILALVAAASSTLLGRFVPASFAGRLSPEAVLRILEILASSMLAVTTFSLSVMVAARQWASSQSTPRAHRLVLEDNITQNALATFLGAFIFALTALILVSTEVQEGRDLVVILGFTGLVIALVVIAILRWIDHLTNLGGVSETADRIEDAARDALRLFARHPLLGAKPLTEDTPREGLEPVVATETGYIRHLDPSELEACAKAADTRVLVQVKVGDFVTEGDPLVLAGSSADRDALRSAFVIGRTRTFDQDPTFGIMVLSEIAQRALSPGTNDPATAIEVIGRILRLLIQVADKTEDDPSVEYPNVFMPPLTLGMLCAEAFEAIARDGADKVEVQVTLQRALSRLTETGDADLAQAARSCSDRALALADATDPLEEDRERMRAAAP